MQKQPSPLRPPVPPSLCCNCPQVIAAQPNVCNYLHMPAQSGASSTLQRMRRGYTREAYDALVARARAAITNMALSTDIITGVWLCARGHVGVKRRCCHWQQATACHARCGSAVGSASAWLEAKLKASHVPHGVEVCAFRGGGAGR